MENKDLVTEISTYSLDDLKLIYETQRDLYSEEEMKIIFKRIQDIEMAEVERKQAFITEHLPNEIIVPNVMDRILLKITSVVFVVMSLTRVNFIQWNIIKTMKRIKLTKKKNIAFYFNT